MRLAFRILPLLALVAAATATAEAAPQPLLLEKIPLGAVGGRLDHLAIDPNRRRLFVAELGNDSLGVVDLTARRSLRIVSGFREPQGVGYEPALSL